MNRTLRLTILLLTLACGMAMAVPRLSEVVPDAVAPGGTAVAKGSDLAKPTVDRLSSLLAAAMSNWKSQSRLPTQSRSRCLMGPR